MEQRISVTAARIYRVRVPLEQPFVLAYKNVADVENVLLRLEDEQGLAGWGCASPESKVTGETVDGAVASLKSEIVPMLVEAPALPLGLVLNALEHAAPGAPCARAAADIALHDLAARRAGRPLIDLLGGPVRDAVSTCMTVSIADVAKTLDDARRFAQRGYRFLKIKCGLDADEDIARVRAVREALPDTVLHLDANQGYTLEHALRVCRALRHDIAFLEQPGPRDDRDMFDALCAQSPVPIMADESVRSPQDALDLFRRGVPLVCVKLMKNGGVAPAVRLCELARSLGRRVMIGCMKELPVSMAAAACVALSQPAVQYADLDGHLDMVQDIARGGVHVENGTARVPGGAPGTGVRVDEAELAAHLVFDTA